MRTFAYQCLNTSWALLGLFANFLAKQKDECAFSLEALITIGLECVDRPPGSLLFMQLMYLRKVGTPS